MRGHGVLFFCSTHIACPTFHRSLPPYCRISGTAEKTGSAEVQNVEKRTLKSLCSGHFASPAVFYKNIYPSITRRIILSLYEQYG